MDEPDLKDALAGWEDVLSGKGEVNDGERSVPCEV